MTNSILLQNVSPEQFTELITTVFKKELEDFKKELITQSENDDLLSREQLLELLQINASTLWHWQNKGRITVYKFANKCYYKRSEIMQSLIALKK
ncbi:helix-turn-helix domain-containing protein [Flavobacterium sp. XN-5]|uniref:helix-turn-helix domain-containing protein n=1 Tax=Flavobacterium sp. XN-5 TaxID=2599390 RepID=UPI0011CB1706|nr:helix-turn-helix domain-containing protein [Flavobacterium sp. XN-5]NGY38863.1 helix-turn-helix domain-containing protein [Flavobacterium sp. XN-5]